MAGRGSRTRRHTTAALLWTLAATTSACRKPIATMILEHRVRSMPIRTLPLTSVQYLLHLPSDYDALPDRRWPIVIYLHGLGQAGDDLDQVLRFGPPRLIGEGRQLPFIIVSPQMPAGYFWFRETNAVLQVLDEVSERYRVDPKRVHLTGNSMGAFGAIMLAAKAPERFASLVPICGGVSFLDSLRLRDIPIWAFHGADDPLIPVEESQRLVRLVNGLGGQAQLTVYPGVGHNAWDRAYDDPALWEWLALQSK
jgi:predicted peptidase